MDFWKSPIQHPKPSLTSMTHNFFETQHRWSRCTISTNSCPIPGRLSHQTILMVLQKITFWQSPSQPPKKSQVRNITTSNLIQMIKVASCHQLMPWPWQIFTAAGLGPSWAINHILHKAHIPDSSSCDFETVDEGHISQIYKFSTVRTIIWAYHLKSKCDNIFSDQKSDHIF